MAERIPPESLIKLAQRELNAEVPGDVAVDWCDTGHSGPGWYAHYTEYPDEGSVFLGGDEDA